MARFDDENQNPRASGSQGRQRVRELADEMREAIKANVAALLAGLEREPTEIERFDAEALCALLLRARRLRDNGRDDSAVLAQYAILRQTTAFHRAPPSTPTV